MRHSGIELLFQGRNLLRLLEGLWVSASIALLAMALSLLLGTALGVVMTTRNPVVRFLSRTYLDTMRIMPQIVLLFVVFFDLTRYFGVNLDGWAAAVVVFTLWGTAELGDLVRAAITSIPRHQYLSARALGLTPWQVQRSVILPQAVRRLLPSIINLTNRMVMTTPLVALIGVVEVLKTGQQIIDPNRFTHPDGALWIYGTILLLYFALCFPISQLARTLERRWS
ncbi:MAG: amino acid ABC transporter permease [Propionibacteriaceae bacterium]|nr:amino acid ABC transporter permease [Propionibacteriaceae bacterium]